MATANHLAGNIRRYLKSKGLGMFAGSEALGLKKYTLRNLLSQPNRTPRDATLKPIATAMGIELKDLISKRVTFSGAMAANAKRGAKTKNGSKAKPKIRNGNGHANGRAGDRGRLFDVALTLCGYELPAKKGRTAGETLAAVVARLEKVMGDIEQEAA